MVEVILFSAITCGFVGIVMSIAFLCLQGFSLSMLIVLIGSILSILISFASLGREHGRKKSK